MLSKFNYRIAEAAWVTADTGRETRHGHPVAIFLVAVVATVTVSTVGTTIVGIATDLHPAVSAFAVACSCSMLVYLSVMIAGATHPSVERVLRRRWYAAAIVAGVHLHCRPLP